MTDNPYRSRFYDMDGKPMLLMDWARKLESYESRVIAFEVLNDRKTVSTVWLGLDHNMSGHGPPLIFESMVFEPDSFDELDCIRYSTKEEALRGHLRLVMKWQTV
jgi:hypothetical protein